MAAIWLTQSDLENATAADLVAAAFDDQNSGGVNSVAIAAIIDRAEQEVMSWLVTELGPPPIPAPVMAQLAADTFLKYAAQDYAVAFMIDRHPEAFRSSREDVKARIDRADVRMQRVLDARQRPPTVATKPANVGGVVVDNAHRIYIDNADGTQNCGDY